ncbi:group 1 glycosyl transferase [[Clostridium] sordellii]|uniref:glycosyltransferase n=2 Tax=Paraclostridium sordellii TaxID=1505 RepID=UPI0005DE83D4|nr:glycosyltransferase [Paeniclostridium sordellii]CEP38766.1 group 1 glycosyl transferase [[Clostridium] sordellii] [Paeniclostridium sordellii]
MEIKRNKYFNMIFLLNVYISLFIFNMINREFTIFDIDLRYVLVFMSIPLILYKIKKIIIDNEKINLTNTNKLVIVFCILLILSNINWIFSDINPGKDFIQYNILLVFNILTIAVCIIYEKELNLSIVYKSILFSGVILFFSMILILLGVNLMKGHYPGIVSGYEHVNFFGMRFRVAGVAEDANYATIFMTIFTATAIYSCKNNIRKVIFTIIGILGIMLSASKTVALGIILGIIFIVILNSKNWKIRRSYNFLKNIFIVTICIGPYVAIKIIDKFDLTSGMSTLDNRFLMWNHAIELFEKKPLLGNGLTSFRAFFNNSLGWYVQCHSTEFQILCEAGIISLIIFALIFYSILKSKNMYVVFITIVCLVFSVTTEINHLALMAFLVGVLPIISRKHKDEKSIDENKILFLINSLGSGGAERVVANSANKMAQMGKCVTIITLKDDINYEFDKNVTIVSLKERNDLSKFRKILNIPLNVIKINNIIESMEGKHRFGLITSHLPIMHITSRMLLIRDRIMFVIHNPHHHMDPNNSIIFKMLLRLQYNGMKVVTVSKGVEEELTIKYGVKCDKIATIYNPINIKNIEKEANESLDVTYKYLLFCGRLTRQKRPDILIDSFYKGGFYKNYKLVLLGEGELLDDLKSQVTSLGIDETVKFMGWQGNVYKWMKNSELMISTSDYEAFPMNLLEALGSSCKVVAIDCDFGPREILKDKYAEYLVPMNDMDKLVETIKKALKSYPLDRKEQVKQFDSDIINRKYLNVYKNWVK